MTSTLRLRTALSAQVVQSRGVGAAARITFVTGGAVATRVAHASRDRRAQLAIKLIPTAIAISCGGTRYAILSYRSRTCRAAMRCGLSSNRTPVCRTILRTTNSVCSYCDRELLVVADTLGLTVPDLLAGPAPLRKPNEAAEDSSHRGRFS